MFALVLSLDAHVIQYACYHIGGNFHEKAK